MAGAIRSLIIGGGIRAGTPSTLSTFPIFSGTTPPDLLVDGNIFQDASSPPKVYIGTDSVGATSTVLGGATSSSFATSSIVIGQGASRSNTVIETRPSVIIGAAAIGGNSTGGGDVIIGASSSVYNVATAAVNVLIGYSNKITAGGASGNIIIGNQCQQTLGSNCITMGSSATITCNNDCIAIGNAVSITGGAGTGAVTIVGGNCGTSKTRNVLIGHSLTDINTASGNIAIIGVGWSSTANMPSNACGFLNSSGFTTMIVGNSHESATPGSLTFRLCNGLGANIAAGSLTLQAGLGTGTGASAVVNIASSIPVGAGSTLQTARTGFRMSPSTTAGQTDIMIYDVDNATLERVTVGAADSGGVGFKLLRIPN